MIPYQQLDLKEHHFKKRGLFPRQEKLFTKNDGP
jgi:hypothetical protein